MKIASPLIDEFTREAEATRNRLAARQFR